MFLLPDFDNFIKRTLANCAIVEDVKINARKIPLMMNVLLHLGLLVTMIVIFELDFSSAGKFNFLFDCVGFYKLNLLNKHF